VPDPSEGRANRWAVDGAALEVAAGEMGFTNGRVLGQIAYIAIMAMAVIVAINQIGIASIESVIAESYTVGTIRIVACNGSMSGSTVRESGVVSMGNGTKCHGQEMLAGVSRR